jgi:drug/metabolite transporter (DMT)-like permease
MPSSPNPIEVGAGSVVESKTAPTDLPIEEKRHVPPMLVLFLGILAVSAASILIRFAQREAPSLVVAAYRIGFAVLILAPVAIKSQYRELKSLSLKVYALMALSGAFLALHFASWITSLEYTTVATAVVLVTSSPLWVALLSPLILRERITRMLGIGLMIALVGGIMVSIGPSCKILDGQVSCSSIAEFTQGRNFVGNLLALAGALFASAYLIIGKQLRSSVSILSYTFVVYGVSAVLLLIGVFATRQPMTGYSPTTYLWFLALAVVPQLIGHSSFNWALKYLKVTYVSVALLGEPIGATLLAYVLLHETPAFLEISGGIMILVGIYLASRTEK